MGTELARTKRSLHQLIEAIKAGVPGASVKDEIGELERRRSEIEAKLAAAPAPKLRLHPNLAELYRRKVAALADALNAETMRSEATAAMRGLIEEIRLAPADGKLRIELFGELAALSHWQAAVVLESNTPGRAVRGCKLRWLRGEDLNL